MENYYLLSLNINDEVSIIKLVKEILIKEKRIDILINNAGVGTGSNIGNYDLSTSYQQAYTKDVYGPINVIKSVLPQMRKQKSGLIINITSIAGYMGLPYRGIYSATKAALEITAESIRMEVQRFGINVSTLAPAEYPFSNFNCCTVKKGYSGTAIFSKENLNKMNDHVNSGSDPNEVAKNVFKIIKTS